MVRDEMLKELAKILEIMDSNLKLSYMSKADTILSALEFHGMLPPDTMRGFNTVNRWDKE